MKFGKTGTNPSVDSGESQAVRIGDITISNFSDGVLWMESEKMETLCQSAKRSSRMR